MSLVNLMSRLPVRFRVPGYEMGLNFSFPYIPVANVIILHECSPGVKLVYYRQRPASNVMHPELQNRGLVWFEGLCPHHNTRTTKAQLTLGNSV